eukprot:3721229-Rhodomonas_salina.1
MAMCSGGTPGQGQGKDQSRSTKPEVGQQKPLLVFRIWFRLAMHTVFCILRLLEDALGCLGCSCSAVGHEDPRTPLPAGLWLLHRAPANGMRSAPGQSHAAQSDSRAIRHERPAV